MTMRPTSKPNPVDDLPADYHALHVHVWVDDYALWRSRCHCGATDNWPGPPGPRLEAVPVGRTGFAIRAALERPPAWQPTHANAAEQLRRRAAEVDAHLEDVAWRIRRGFRHDPEYDKADVLVELRALAGWNVPPDDGDHL